MAEDVIPPGAAPDPAAIIGKRVSVRSYEKRPLDESDRAFISRAMEAAEKSSQPFGGNVHFSLIDADGISGKIGTYGIIRNAPAFIAATLEPEHESLLALGFRLEQLVLSLTGRKIGSCWLAGTFNRTELGRKLSIPEGELLAVLLPVGYPAGKEHLQAKAIRRLAGSSGRKPFEALFFDREGRGLGEKTIAGLENGALRTALLAARKAPSASNKQPWRFVIDSSMDEVSVYLDRDPGYEKMVPSFSIQTIDAGIAMAHLDLVLSDSAGKPCCWEVETRRVTGKNWDAVAGCRFT